MRFFPFRRRSGRSLVAPHEDLLVTEEMLRRNVEDVLVVRERKILGGVIVFRGDLMVAPGSAVDALVERFRPYGYTPFLKEERDSITVQAWPLADVVDQPRVGLTVTLFVLTCLTTLLAGAFFVGSPMFDALRSAAVPLRFLSGIPFAAPLLAILATHEFGHYFTARFYRAAVSLPYFIPAPPPFLFGTLGAVIRMKSPPRDRNSLFDIAAAGPIAGLAIAVPAMLVGLQWSTLAPPSDQVLLFGDSLLRRFLVYLHFGAIPDGLVVHTHPVADAAWAGFFVTALNLFPVGQLDGGRIAYALFGARHRLIGRLTFVSLLALAAITWSPNWLVWAALIFFLVGFGHQPPLDDVTPLSPARRLVGLLCLVLLVLLIPPIPIG